MYIFIFCLYFIYIPESGKRLDQASAFEQSLAECVSRHTEAEDGRNVQCVLVYCSVWHCVAACCSTLRVLRMGERAQPSALAATRKQRRAETPKRQVATLLTMSRSYRTHF